MRAIITTVVTATFCFLCAQAQAAACLKSDPFRASKVTVDLCTRELSNSALTETERAKLLEQRGNANYWQQQFNLAIEDFNKAIAIDSSLNESRIQRGWAYLRVGQTESGFTDFSNALEQNPRSARAVFAIGYIYGYEGDRDKERQAYEQAVSLDPTYYLARSNLALFYEQKASDLARALSTYDALIAEGREKLNKTEFWTNSDFQTKNFFDDIIWSRNRILIKMGKAEEARQAALKLLKIYPDDSALFLMIADSYETAQPDLEKSLAWTNKAYALCEKRDIDEDCYYVALKRMQSLSKLQRLSDLKVTAEKLISQEIPDWYKAAPRFFLGVVKKKSNDLEGAKEDFLWARQRNDFYQRALITQLLQNGYYDGGTADPWSIEAENGLEACLIDQDCMRR